MIKLLVIALFLIHRTNPLEKFIDFKYGEIVYNPKYVTNGTCSLKQKGTSVEINVDFDILVDLRNLTMRVVIYRMTNGEFLPQGLNENIVVCDFLKSNNLFSLNYFAQKMYKIAQKYSNALVCIHKVGFFFHFNYFLILMILILARSLPFSERQIQQQSIQNIRYIGNFQTGFHGFRRKRTRTGWKLYFIFRYHYEMNFNKTT